MLMMPTYAMPIRAALLMPGCCYAAACFRYAVACAAHAIICYASARFTPYAATTLFIRHIRRATMRVRVPIIILPMAHYDSFDFAAMIRRHTARFFVSPELITREFRLIFFDTFSTLFSLRQPYAV